MIICQNIVQAASYKDMMSINELFIKNKEDKKEKEDQSDKDKKGRGTNQIKGNWRTN